MSRQKPRIVVLGSINMDLVLRCDKLPLPGETRIGISSQEVSGGKGANQAVAAARLGADVAMIGRVGSDAFAERLLNSLKREGVEIAAVGQCSDCASGLAIVAVESSGENSIIVVPGANGRIDREDAITQTELIRSADVLVMQLEIPIDTVLAAVNVAKALGIKTILNPAPMPERLDDRLWSVDVLCPNQTEASILVGRAIESIEDARSAIPALLERGAKCAVITMGSQGAVVGDLHSVEWVPPYPIQPVDTTAAGDAFVAGFAVRWSEGYSIQDSVKFGCAAGAIAATRWGAQPGMPSRQDVEEMIAKNV